jgi:putative acetyltransferase
MRSPEISIRPERPGDAGPIAQVVREAFAGHPHSRQTEAHIVAALRGAGVLAISLVAEREGTVVGYVAFSPVTISDGTMGWFGLGPVAVAPAFQRRGIGGALIREGLASLRAHGARGCVVLGDPGYYRRFGFGPNPTLTLAGVPAEYFLALALEDDIPRGEVTYHEAFAADG